MEYWLNIYTDNGQIELLFDDKEASRGATIAGVRRANNLTKLEAFDVDTETGKRWDKEL